MAELPYAASGGTALMQLERRPTAFDRPEGHGGSPQATVETGEARLTSACAWGLSGRSA